MDQASAKLRQQSHAFHCFPAAFGIDVIATQRSGGKHMQPVTLAMKGATGLICVGHRRAQQRLADRLHRGGGILSAALDEVGQGSRTERAAEQFGKSLGSGAGKGII